MIIQWLIRLYRVLLCLYPRSFRAEFSQEMQDVYIQALQNASNRGALSTATFVFHELVSLPSSLALARQGNKRIFGALPAVKTNYIDHSWQELLLVLAIFLLPGGVILLNQSPQASAPSSLSGAFLFLGVMLFLGWLGGFPLWSQPYVGIVIVIAGYLVLFQWLIGIISPALIDNFSPGLGVSGYPAGSETYLLLQAAANGMLWLMLFCLTLLIIALLAVFNRFQPLMSRMRHDWTLLSYILYGESVFALLLLFESRRFEISYVVGGLLCLLAGAWFFLRSPANKQRMLALLGCLTLAVLIAVIGKWPLAGENFTWSKVPPTDLGRLLLAWAWMVSGLLLPGFLANLPQRFNLQR